MATTALSNQPINSQNISKAAERRRATRDRENGDDRPLFSPQKRKGTPSSRPFANFNTAPSTRLSSLAWSFVAFESAFLRWA